MAQTSGPLKDAPYLAFKTERGKPYTSITYGEFGTMVFNLASGFAAKGIMRGDRIALISESRPEWVAADFASILIGAISVPMFPTLTSKQIEYIIQHSGAKVVVVSNDLQLGKVVKIAAECPAVELILVMNKTFNPHPESPVAIVSFDEVLSVESPIDIEAEARNADGEDVVTIIYTSGTTGTPKGVMLTHNNLVSNVQGALAALPPIGSHDVFLSFLPLSHSFERIASYFLFYSGASAAFAESIDTIADNLLEIRPTIMTGVPRFYERMCGRIMRMRESLPDRKKKLFDWAIRVGSECAKRLEGENPAIGALLERPIADMLVLKKIRARTGGRVRFFVSGGAALSAETGRAFAGFGIIILEGYGMTESSPIISVTPTHRIKWGSVGLPLPNIDVKIADDGEILTRGPHVMKGYYRAEEATKMTIDTEGWLHTGDIGILDEDGYLKITDRKKYLFVSPGGKNIAPGPIETLLLRSPLIEQIMLIGDRREFNTALIVPNYDELRKSIKEFESSSNDELAVHSEVRDRLTKELDVLQKELASFERVRRFALLPEAFTVENGLLTPTLKVKRKEVESRYEELIESLYREFRK
ncbi:MAG: long-chain fatty acid--CoA ligase [Bacteroidota bacterium]|nr:long-chain fatty acid--CoA ligase [Bacteroidota bacterium]